MVAVSETLHFGRAARQCAVTQPALSAQIQQVEDLLGVQIFERGRRRVLVTPAGARLVAQAREALAAIDSLVSLAETGGRPLVGPLRLGVIPTVAPYFLPPLLPAVRKAYPELRLILREEQTGRLVSQLEAGALDVVLIALPVQEADLVELPLFDEPFVFVAPEDHPLVRRGARISESVLEGEEVLLLEDGHCLRDQALSICKRAGARTPDRIQATSLSTLVQMVANGLGVTLLPERALDQELRPESGLVARSFRPPAPTRSIGLAWRRGAAREAEYEELGKCLQAAARPKAGSRKRSTGRR